MSRLLSIFGAVTFVCVVQAQEPDWLKQARAREGASIAASEIKSSDNWFTAKVPAKLVGKIEKVDGSYSVEFDIGGDAAVYCEVVPDGLDMADTLRRGLEGVLKETAATQGKVETRALEHMDAGAIGAMPFLQTRWIYRVDTGEKKQLGGIKQIVFERPEVGVYCMHVDVGYVQTFDTLTRAFAASLKVSDPAAPYYREISTWRFQGMNVGVSAISLTKDADGDTLAETVMAILMPGTDQVVSDDTVRREWLRPDNSLINGVHVVARNGELTTNLKMDFDEEVWKISGAHQGKTIAKSLKPDEEPQVWVKQSLELRKLLASEKPVGAEHSIALWDMDELLVLSNSKTRITGKAGDAYKATSSSGDENKVTLTLDKNGTMISGEVAQQGMVIKATRVYVEGSF